MSYFSGLIIHSTPFQCFHMIGKVDEERRLCKNNNLGSLREQLIRQFRDLW